MIRGALEPIQTDDNVTPCLELSGGLFEDLRQISNRLFLDSLKSLPLRRYLVT